MLFELLCIDKTKSVSYRSISKILLTLQGNDDLDLGIPENNKVSNVANNLSLEIQDFDTSQITVGERDIPAYVFIINSNDFEILEAFRMKIIEHLKDIKFSHISILSDDISREIASKAYPLIYAAENELRKFVMSFLTRKIGVDFLRYVVPKDIIDNSNKHKNNEPHFIASGKVQNDVSLLYFNELGKIVYDESIFAKAKPSSILEKVKSATNLDALKTELLEGNFQKYFTDMFAKNDFTSKWTRINELRNKVAHNSYFLSTELVECEKLSQELLEIISDAFTNIDSVKLSVSDMETLKEAIDDNIVQRNDIISSVEGTINEKQIQGMFDCMETSTYITISEEELLATFDEVAGTIPFVAFSYFVNDILAPKGYSFDSIYTQINILIDRGVLATGKVPNPHGGYDVTSLNRL